MSEYRSIHDDKVSAIAECYAAARREGLDHDAAEAEVNRLRTSASDYTTPQQHEEGIALGRTLYND